MLTTVIHTRRLPIELIEAILDHLHDDNKSLKPCSLVCKDWIHPVRRLLFSRWTIHLPHHVGAEIDLSLRISTVLPFLRHLCVRNCDGPQGWNADLPLLVGQNHIQSLHLLRTDLHFDGGNPHMSSVFLHNLSGVVNLSLDTIIFSDVPTLVGIFCSFPRLQALSIRTSGIQRLGLGATMFQPSPHLVALNLDILRLHKLLEWFLALAVFPSFRSVHLYYNHSVDGIVMQKFIASLDNSLEHLSFPVYDSPHLLFNLSHLTQLRSINLAPCTWNSSTASFTHILSSLSSPCLQLVVFRLSYWVHPNVGIQLGWEEIDALLQTSPFAGLKEVYFDYTEFQEASLIDQIVPRMPQCRARGILTTCESTTRDWRSYGLRARGVSETFGCGLPFRGHP